MKKAIYVADCETDPFLFGRVPKPFIWGLYTNHKETYYLEFKTPDEFVDYIKEKDCIVYAHNGGKFDWHFILHRIEPFSDCNIINGRLAKFKIGKAEFRDSFNILPVPLAAYKKDDFDYNKMEEEERHKYMEEIREYLKDDCIYLNEIVARFIEEYGLNLTLAGAALKTWQKISGIKAPETSRQYYQDLKKYYYGGRVECFEAGIINDSFNVVDINSAYPYAMKHSHPYGQQAIIKKSLPTDKGELQRCFITLTCISVGAFPFREDDGSLRFPRDHIEREYHVTGWEYIAAMETDTIKNISVKQVVTFTDKIDFGDYIDHFYTQKDECKKNDDKAGYILAKLFLNSLYGKFGANADNYQKYMFVQPRFIEAAEMDGYDYSGEVGDWALMARDLEEEEQRYYDVAVAASITGFVRAYMWSSICKCDGVIYCDTDSIASRDSTALDYDASILGAWDIEAECDYGAVAGKKMYAFRDLNGKWKTATKGVKLSPQEIVKVAMGETVTYKNEAPSMSVRKNPTFLERSVAFNAKIN